MLNRVRQVWSALNARITAADMLIVRDALTEAEQRLFWNMSLPDQRHALNVAQTALRLTAGRNDINAELLLRCALLHDVGRQNKDVSTWDKIFAVLLHKAAPGFALSYGREGRGGKLQNFRHAIFIYFNHPARSAALLEAVGTEAKAVFIVSRHHKAPAVEEPPELVALRTADSLN